MDVINHICNQVQQHKNCSNLECNKLHFDSYEISNEKLYELSDLFYILEQTKSLENVEYHFSKNQIMEIELPKPILCSVCYKIISNNDYYFPCCKKYVCSLCKKNWKFPKYCPYCGTFYRHVRHCKIINSEPEIQEAVKSNSYLVHPIPK